MHRAPWCYLQSLRLYARQPIRLIAQGSFLRSNSTLAPKVWPISHYLKLAKKVQPMLEEPIHGHLSE